MTTGVDDGGRNRRSTRRPPPHVASRANHLLGFPDDARLLLVNADDLGMYHAVNAAVVDDGLQPTHLDWHCLADGGRDDVFDLTLALADEYGLAVRAWLDPNRRKLSARGVPVVDHPFLDSFSLDLQDKSARYCQLLRDLPVGLSEWAVHPGRSTREARAQDPGHRVRQTDHDFLTSPHARDLVREEGIVLIDHGTLRTAWP